LHWVKVEVNKIFELLGGRRAFRNRFPYWVAENIRKIKPNAPDTAIDEIVED